MPLEIKVPGFSRLDEYCGVWLCEENAFRLHWERAQRVDWSAHFAAEQPPLQSQMELLATRNGKSVAVIPILGVMMKQRSSMGGTSTVQVRRDIRNAAADPNVSGILLAIESPGGTTAGLDDLAAEVRAARKSKPVFAHVDDLMASAAYWIGSQTEQITANAPTALVGSIGTILTVYDQSAAAEQAGVKTLVFATGHLKGAGTPGTRVTEEQVNYFQGLVNGIQAEFDSAVRKGRKLSQKQLEDVRSGAVWKATEAQAKGLIDGIQPLSKTIEQLSREAPKGAVAFVGNHLPARPPGTSSTETKMDFTQWLAANVPNHEDLTDEQRDNLRAAWKVQNTPAPPPPAPPVAQLAPPAKPVHQSMEAVIAAAKANEERKARITELLTECITERPETIAVAEAIAKQAIESNWDVDKFRLELLVNTRNVYGNGGQINLIASSRGEMTEKVLEAAFCMQGGLGSLEKHFDERTLNAARKHHRNGIGIQELVLHFAQRNGYRGRSIKNDPGPALRAAFREGDIRSEVGPSTYSLPNILANVANKYIIDAFNAVDMTWRMISAIRSVNDFKAISSFSLTGDNTYEEVPPGGEIKHGTLGETTYSNQAKTYGKMIGIDRRDIINDDTNAFAQVNRRLGRGGALKLNDVFWTAFLNNSSFFTVGRGNADSGADTLMDLTGLANGWGLFQAQTDPDGKPLGTQPKIVLVPPALWPSAWTLLMSTTLNMATSNAASTGTSSPWTGMFRLATSPYMANSSFTGYSAAAWYMLADPSDIPVIEVCFLNGNEMPTIETADMDFDRLGIALRGYYDFGCALMEYRGGVRLAGA